MTRARAAGDRIGPYELVQLLGSGGMGAVWEAVLHGPAGFRKPVALKLLHASPSEHDRELLIREARLGARLQHPNVVGVLALGEAEGTWHVAMDLVRGASVAELAARERLPPSAIVEIGIQAAAGLAHVHALVVDGQPAGLVHCDVKPENLLVDCTGLVKVADLGVASLAGERRGAAGTPGYMAPEQVNGAPESRSDLFSLGATLYTLATGATPFGHEPTARTILSVLEVEDRLADPRFLAPVDAAVPGLGAVVRGCLRRSPSDRYASARELAVALSELRARFSAPADLLTLLQRVRPDLADLAMPTGAALTSPSFVLGAVGNLPSPRDRFVGREDELARIVGLLGRGERLVSLLALGGMGKTRLALAAARRAGDELGLSTWFFSAAEARDLDGLCAAVASGLSIPLDRADPALQVGTALAAKGPSLVVLDNLEPCADAARRALALWLELAPDASFLVTSRVALRAPGERIVALDPLSPADARALFLERAPVAVPSAHDPELAALCAGLGGMPLAIELAAARLRLLPVPRLRQRLADGLGLLAAAPGSELPERHRSVEASLRGSFELLGVGARATLAQLSVFAGGLALEAAEAVVELPPSEGWVLDALQELTEASMVRVDPDVGRLSLLPVVHAFAAARLEPGVRAAAEARHGAYFAQLGTPEALGAVHLRGGVERFGALAAEIDNLVVAVRRAVARSDAAVAVPAALAAGVVLDRIGPAALGVELGEAVLALDLDPRQRALVSRMVGWAAHGAGRGEEARARFELALSLARAVGDAALEGETLSDLGTVRRVRGDLAGARELYEAARAVLERAGDRLALARTLAETGSLHSDLYQPAEARAAYEKSLALRRAVGDRRGEAQVLANLGVTCMRGLRYEEALRWQQDAVAAYRETGDRRGEAQILGDLGLTLAELGRAGEAERHYLAAESRLRAQGNLRFLGIVLSNLGWLRVKQDRAREADETLAAALEVHRRCGNRRSEGVAIAMRGLLRQREGREAEAAELLREALALHAETGNTRWEARTWLGLAEVLARRGDAAGAREALEHAVRGAEALGDAELLEQARRLEGG